MSFTRLRCRDEAPFFSPDARHDAALRDAHFTDALRLYERGGSAIVLII